MAFRVTRLVLGSFRMASMRRVGAALVLAVALAGIAGSTAQAATSGTAENENAVVTATCSSVNVEYRNFPNAPNNTVNQTLTIHGATVSKAKVTFNGPTGSYESAIVVPPGPGVVDIHATWETNGSRGHFDLGVPLECPPAPEFTITKLQKIEGSKTGFTTAPLTGKVGQTVDYEIIVKNTGNVPLVFSNFTDEQCGTVTGGPGATPIEKGGSAVYRCSHVLTEVGPYNNTATDTAKASTGNGPPITRTSNTVVVNVPPDPAYTITKLQEIAGSNAGFTTAPLLGEVGQTVNYEIVVKNTGNVPLTFGEFTDAKCTGLTGGPGEEAVAPGASTSYFCSHTLTEAHSYSNSATVTGTPPLGDGSPIVHTSNPVVVVTNPSEKGKEEGENGEVIATCSYVSVTYHGFPNLPNNTVTQTITIHGAAVSKTKFTFNGSTGTDIVAIVVPPGTGVVDAHATWSTNGFVGHFDIGVSLECPPEPSLSITKLQQIEGTNTGFTTSPLTTEPGGTVDYQIVVKNIGNVPLALSSFIDEECAGIAGGATKLALHATTTYTCSRSLPTVGTYSNTASVNAKRSPGTEPPVTYTSNTVVVKAQLKT